MPFKELSGFRNSGYVTLYSSAFFLINISSHFNTFRVLLFYLKILSQIIFGEYNEATEIVLL